MSISVAFILLSCFSTFFLVLKILFGSKSRLVLYFPTALVFLFYLIVETRSDGVDVSNYRDIFYGLQSSNDFGYDLLCRILAYSLNFNFSQFLLLLGFVNVVLIYCISKSLRVDFPVVFLVYSMHLAVVRDYAQIRIGLAMLLMFFGIYTIKNIGIRTSVVLLAISFQLTSIFYLVGHLIYVLYRDTKIPNWIFLLLPFILLISGSILPLFSILDPRIEIYMGWNAAGFGSAVESYNVLFFYVYIIAMCAWCIRYSHSVADSIREIFFISIGAPFLFIGLSDLSIFAGRLSNIIFSGYPFLVAATLFDRNRSKPFLRSILLLIMVGMLLSRADNLDIFASMSF